MAQNNPNINAERIKGHLDLDASTSTSASFRIRAGADVSVPNTGDMWIFNGYLKIYNVGLNITAGGFSSYWTNWSSNSNFNNALGNNAFEISTNSSTGFITGTLSNTPYSIGTNNTQRLKISQDGSLILCTPPTLAFDGNTILLSSTNYTGGFLWGTTAIYSATYGPYFVGRGNTYTTYANQRGILVFSAGNITSSPSGDEGSILFSTGNDIVRLKINRDGDILVTNLAGTGTRLVQVNSSGVLSTTSSNTINNYDAASKIFLYNNFI